MNRTLCSIAASTILALFIFHGQQASCYEIVNKTDQEVTAFVKEANRRFEIKKLSTQVCPYEDEKCKPPDVKELHVQIIIKEKEAHFTTIVPTLANGRVTVYQLPSHPWVPGDAGRYPGYYVESEYPEDPNDPLSSYTRLAVSSTKRDDTTPLGADPDVKFYVTADTHFGLSMDTDKLSRGTFDGMLAHLEGSSSARPQKCCSTINSEVRGIIVAGDLTDGGSADQRDTFYNYVASFSHFLYEGYGNHDKSKFVGYVMGEDRLRESKPVSISGPYYSWDWGGVHFVQLNLYPCVTGHDSGHCDKSLPFLKEDLKLVPFNTPIVIFHHYGFDPSSKELDKDGKPWWSDDERKNYWDAIKDYAVAAIFTGHIHLDANPLSHYQYNFNNPAPTVPPGERKYIPAFVAGAAKNGVWLEVSIRKRKMEIQRWASDGNKLRLLDKQSDMSIPYLSGKK